jgi:hypothetical protein
MYKCIGGTGILAFVAEGKKGAITNEPVADSWEEQKLKK